MQVEGLYCISAIEKETMMNSSFGKFGLFIGVCITRLKVKIIACAYEFNNVILLVLNSLYSSFHLFSSFH